LQWGFDFFYLLDESTPHNQRENGDIYEFYDKIILFYRYHPYNFTDYFTANTRFLDETMVK